MIGGFFLWNGQFFREGEPVFSLGELVHSSEGFCCSFRAEHNEVLFVESISVHLINRSLLYGIDLSGLVDAGGILLRKDVSRLLNKNKLYKAARVTARVFRQNDRTGLILEAWETHPGFYPLTEPGLLIKTFPGIPEEQDPFPPQSVIPLKLAASLYAAEINREELILFNRDGFAVESLHGSFALISGNTAVFPLEKEGSASCAIRELVVRCTVQADLGILTRGDITLAELLAADELFLFDDVHGIRKVTGLGEQRFLTNRTRLISKNLTTLARLDRQKRDLPGSIPAVEFS